MRGAVVLPTSRAHAGQRARRPRRLISAASACSSERQRPIAAAGPARPLLATGGGGGGDGDAQAAIPPPSRPTPKGVPRLVSDADLLRSLRGEDGAGAGGLASRAFAPPAEPRVCRCCSGTATVPCPACGGSGRLPAGGYRATNPVLMPKIVGTQWTAAERTLGRTHFRCAAKRRAPGEGGGDGLPASGCQWFVLMVAACDESVRLWVEARSLRDRARWTPGWVTVADVVDRRGRKDGRGVSPRAGAGCKACGGDGRAPCPLCTRPGALIEV